MSRGEEPRDESGFTLVEILMTVWIMGALMVALMSALLAMTKASDVNRSNALANAELRHYAEDVRNAPYVQCADSVPLAYSASSVGYVPATGVVAAAPTIYLWDRYLDPTGTITTANKKSSAGIAADANNSQMMHYENGACDGSADQVDDGMQLITLQVTVGSIQQSTTFTKRSPTVGS